MSKEKVHDDIYVLMRDDEPQVAHTTFQGAAMEMAGRNPEEQKRMWVAPVDLVNDD